MTLVTQPLPPCPEPLAPERLAVPARLDRLEEILAFALPLSRKAGLASDRLAAIELVVEEAAVNIITHAYPEQPGILEITCWSDSEDFIVELADTGTPYDPTAAPDPDTSLTLEERAVGGLGLLFIRRHCDKLAWRREAGRNILSCRFLIEPPAVCATDLLP